MKSVYAKAKVQLCMVHKVRQSLKDVSWKDRKKVAAELRKFYSANSVDEAELAHSNFAKIWDEKFPSIRQTWQRDWPQIISFFDYPADIRKAIDTTNAIESMNMRLRNVIKNKRVFSSEDSVFKILY